ncbi:hypothetical protein AFK49_002900 [Corynebacterium ulcerans]|nr:hypothetical protein AFK49_002900 [Corynebacterium ulcerans]
MKNYLLAQPRFAWDAIIRIFTSRPACEAGLIRPTSSIDANQLATSGKVLLLLLTHNLLQPILNTPNLHFHRQKAPLPHGMRTLSMEMQD